MERETTECRGCGTILNGKPYWKGYSYVYHPITKQQAKSNYYGGYVCSYACDYSVCLEMQNSMPGGGYIENLVHPEYLRNWEEDLIK